MLRFALCFAAALAPMQAAALSCLAPNPARAFNEAHASETVYVMARGSLKPVGAIPEVPPVKMEEQQLTRPPIRTTYTFSGRSIGPFSMGGSETAPVEVSVSCLGIWCGGFPQSIEDGVFFFEKSPETGLTLQIGACPSAHVNAPIQDGLVEVLQKCFRNGACSEADMERFSLY